MAHQGDVRAIAITSDGSYVLSVGQDKTAFVSELATGQLVATWHTDARFTSAAWVPGTHIFIAGDNKGAVHILRLSKLNERD
jgi:WD40 repeat protein